MIISPVPSFTSPVTSADGLPRPSNVENIRSLKMTTNVTPDYIPHEAQNLPILSNNEPTKEPEVTEPISPQFARLAKERRALQVMKRELEAEKRAMAQKSQGGDSIPLSRLKSEPLSVLLENGVTYDQLTEAILAGQGNSEINALKAELNALKKGVDQKFMDERTAAEKQVLFQMKQDALQLVSTDENFEFVRTQRKVPEVMRLIEQTYRRTGEVLDVKQACELVENELFKDAQQLAKLKKLQSQFAPQQPMQPMQQRQTGMRTLSNKDTASIPASAKQRAMAAFYGTLKR